ncbi:helix-turn-helix domain-containing protein [Patescibacteria group bacterium]|nr:helix-turn-helix domain-containing protein [Patescibacteria group bacterium]MCG2701816.1 helix-turn-helix domain-containing protein [Candidatus Parcubacteria bacterium]MBU4265223.1 helix-turn-helix domain-containing protein [Patescibacteria group bacterium]MBU4390300.1 helix-turn-helix domain-containing protein [Patescibacteria group bacterium]MBU4397187.1 helix-turn-helix domain-containing protein [Patescibacteria group bacterium]
MNNQDNSLPRLIGIKKAAEMLSVHPATLRRWDNEGKLKAIRIGSRKKVGDRRYRLEDVQKLMQG